MAELLTEILGGLTPVQFFAASFYLCLGLQLNMLAGVIRRLSTIPVRKVNYKLFICRAYASLLTGLIVILLCKQIFGFALSSWLACAAGLAVDLVTEKLFKFARKLYDTEPNTDDGTDNKDTSNEQQE